MTINPPHARSRMLLPLVLILLFFGWRIGTVRDIQDTEKVRKMTETMKTMCVGRFLIDVPAEAYVSFRGAFLQGWDVSTYSDENDEQFVMRLASKEAELKNRKNEKGDTSLESTVKINGNGVHGKLFIFDRNWVYGIVDGERKDDTFAATLAYVRRQDISVNFSSEAGADKINELKKIVTKIQPLAEGQIPTEPGFCFGRAMLLDPLTASQNERVTMFLTLKGHPDFLIALDSAAGLKPSDPLLVRDARNRDQFAAHLTSYRRGPRTIGGVPGEELIDGFHENNGTTGYSCEWASTPDQNDVFRPELDLEFTSGHSIRPGGPPVESSLSARAVLMLWDKISSSIRVRPTHVAKAQTG